MWRLGWVSSHLAHVGPLSGPQSQFKEISLKDYKGQIPGAVLLSLDFTFVCPTEIIAFSDRAEESARLAGEYCTKEGGLGKMNIPLLADKSMETSKAYGC
ncbi:Peroxiredoxin-1 [Chionoecetes opilio]|uniref:thioredoxin-dependent peroxiredoxin n=1 Tax=Chionoecetes opilio TaxID=41210 RepID=A0A8J4YSV9_CHIOP|nr:Peroxiredoxin-1 [Chionoecetes opilio]